MSWFSNLVHKFGHILKHVGAVLADTVAISFGVPPGVTTGIAEILMHAHAGDHKAKAKVRAALANPRQAALYRAVNQHLTAHPDFARFKAHVASVHPQPPHGHYGHTAGLTTHSAWGTGLTSHGDWGTGYAPDQGPGAALPADGPFAVAPPPGPSYPQSGYVPHPHYGHDWSRGLYSRHHPGFMPYGPLGPGADRILAHEHLAEQGYPPGDTEPERWYSPRHPYPWGTPGI